MPRKKKTALADGLYFVVSNGPKPPSDPAVRTIIRRQAMRDVGVGRKVRNAEKKLAKTCPAPKSRMPDQLEQQLIVRGTDSVSARSTESPGGTGSTPDVVFEEEWNPGEECEFDLMANWSHAPHDSKDFSPSFITLPVPMSRLTGYEAARVRFGIDLSMLDRLTSFSVGKTTMGQLAEDPSRMFSLVLDSKPENTHSYLALVPKRYEESKVLAAATDCLLAKASSTLMPCVENEVASSKLYARALNALQRTIADDANCMFGCSTVR